MAAVGDDATARMGLFLEEKKSRGAQWGDLDHEVVQALVFTAVEAIREFAHGGVVWLRDSCGIVNLNANRRLGSSFGWG